MAKYNWKQLEQEYILGDYKSVSAFLREKNIDNKNGSVKKAVIGWKEKKALKEHEKSTKTIEKVIEKTSTEEAKKIITVNNIANDLLVKINESISELNKYIAKTTTKTKTVEFNYKVGKPSKETIIEEGQVNEYISIIDRNGLKQLTSALKDINEILNNKSQENSNSFASEIEKAWSKRNE